ncbi:MAG: hypothetical protein IT370_31870 [Deltaproteobacteria bacterium]|nr:hypothetical protein [Deltaproteobacteria bacterium]
MRTPQPALDAGAPALPGVERVDLRDPSGGAYSCRPLGPLPEGLDPDEVLFSCGRHDVFHVAGGKLAPLATVKVWAQELPASALSGALQLGRHDALWDGSQLIGIGKTGIERWVGPGANDWDQLPEVLLDDPVASMTLSPGPGHQLWVLTRTGQVLRGKPPMLVPGRLVLSPVCAPGVLEREFGVQSALNGRLVVLANDRIYLVLVSDRQLSIARIDPERCAPTRVVVPPMPPQPVDVRPPGAVGQAGARGLAPVGYAPPFLGAVQPLGGKLMLHRRVELLELADDDTWVPWSLPAGVDLGLGGGAVELRGGGFVWTTFGSVRMLACRARVCQALALPAGTELAWAAAWPDGRIALYERQPRLTLLPAP